MKLLTVGDSFTYGDELTNPKEDAWPIVLARKLNTNLINRGDPGCCNWRMVRWVLESSKEVDLVIIAWSSFLRIEFADESGDYVLWPGSKSKWFTNYASSRVELLNHITLHHNEEYLYKQYLNYIILIQNYLKQQNKKYIMLDTFDNHNYRTMANTQKLSEQVETNYFLGWPNESMMEWTHGCPKGPGGHFLEQGHEIVANKIYEHIRHLSWIP